MLKVGRDNMLLSEEGGLGEESGERESGAWGVAHGTQQLGEGIQGDGWVSGHCMPLPSCKLSNVTGPNRQIHGRKRGVEAKQTRREGTGPGARDGML